MFAKLTGKVSEALGDYLILEVAGVGYRVEPAFVDIEVEQQVSLYIHTHVREQEIRLFGFKTLKELNIFEELLTVSGVGPKAALSLLKFIGVDEILLAVDTNQPELLKTPGVGPKTIKRIIIDLKDRLKSFTYSAPDSIAQKQMSMQESAKSEVMQALGSLGYTAIEIKNALSRIEGEDIQNTDELIKRALKVINK